MNKKVEFPINAYPVSSDLLDAVHGFDSQELFWLSGYCSGLAKGRSDPLASLSDSLIDSQSDSLVQNALYSSVTLNTLVLFASQTGNSQKTAESLLAQLDKKMLTVELANLEDFNPKNLSKFQIILLVVSTHGEGEPPDDAIEFYDFVKSKRAPKLDNVQHAVLALGDSSYEYFCQTGKDFDEAFIKLGSKSLLERVDCDLDFEVDANQWISSLVEKISALSSPGESNASSAVDPKRNDTQLDRSQFSKENPFTASILSNQKITGQGSSKCVHHIEISLENSGLQYLPGDSIGIWAKNNPQTVDEILNLTQLDGEQFVSIKGVSKSLRGALLENLEVSLINKSFINAYADLILLKDKQGAEQLIKTTTLDYSSYIQNHQLLDVIALAPIPLEAQQLVDLLKPIKPRIYSISSSLEANEDEAHITVGLKESVNDNATRRGTASEFLIERLQEDDQVLVFIESNKRFKLPADDTPVIMIGPGTGIAPFRAFLQQRQQQSAKGENWLFFGNPHFNTDFLYQLELQKYHKQGVLTHLDLAFSRDQQAKNYVQDRLLENATNIWNWLDKKGAALYVCGDMKHMAKDVEKALAKIISEQGGKSIQQAEDFLKFLKKENRYQRDVY